MGDTPAVVQDDVQDSGDDELTAVLEAGKSPKVEDKAEIQEGETSEEESEKPTEPEPEPETVTISKKEYENLQNQTKELRTVTLQQKRQMATLESRINRLAKPKAVDASDELGDDQTETTKPSEDEVLEQSLQQVKESRAGLIDAMLDVMEDSTKFADVKTVCSDGRVSDIVNAVASQIAQDEGVSYHTAALKVENHIWTRANPYKYLYGLIKEYHPDFASKAEAQDKSAEAGEGKEGAATTGKKSQKPVKAPGSVADLPGVHDAKSSGWTAAKIDDLPEDELGKVPPDIYDKYMAGELD